MYASTYRSSPLTNLVIITLVIVLFGAAALMLKQITSDGEDQGVQPTQTALAALATPPTMSDPQAPTAAAQNSGAIASTPVAQVQNPNGDIFNTSLFIPSVGVYAPVIRVYLSNGTWNIDNLGMNVGHLEGTRWLGQGPGNIVLSGHVEMRDGRQGIFGKIGELEPGDLVVLNQDGQDLRYSVSEVRSVPPDDLTPLYPTLTDRLTLITCEDYNFFSNDYGERTIVVAELVG